MRTLDSEKELVGQAVSRTAGSTRFATVADTAADSKDADWVAGILAMGTVVAEVAVAMEPCKIADLVAEVRCSIATGVVARSWARSSDEQTAADIECR